LLAGRSPKLAAFGTQIDPLDRFAPLMRVVPHPGIFVNETLSRINPQYIAAE
jgi:hypothetical protein